MQPRLRLTPFRRAAGASAFAAGFAFANLVVALPLLVFFERGSPSLAGVLVGANTVAFVVGAGAAGLLRRPDAGMAFGLASIAAGELAIATAVLQGTAGLAVGALLHGTGMGLFWAGTMAALSRRAGALGSPHAFVGQYVIFTVGTAAGGVLTGVAIAWLHAAGLGAGTSMRLSVLLGVLCATAALPPVLAWLRSTGDRPARQGLVSPLGGLAIQIPDLFLTASAGIFVALTPIVLHESFRFSPAAIGAVSGAIGGAKILGSLAAGRIGRRLRVARLAPAMILAGAGTVGSLAITRSAGLYVALLLLSVVLVLGVWPVLVDGSLARVAPARRLRFSIAWNMREYTVIAAATTGGGLLVHDGERPTLLLAIASALLLGAAAGAFALLRRPHFDPSAAPLEAGPAAGLFLPHVVHHPNLLDPAPARAAART